MFRVSPGSEKVDVVIELRQFLLLLKHNECNKVFSSEKKH